jgi:hypothetical protein
MYLLPEKVLERLLMLAFGPQEFREANYLRTHEDIAAAVKRAEMISGLRHYLQVGMIEDREIPARDFSEEDYLSMYPDIREAVTKGVLGSGYAHWVEHGWLEGRLPRDPQKSR